MSSQVVADFIGLMLLGGIVGAIAATVSGRGMRARLAEAALPLSAAVAVGATTGSLYFSEGANFIPCELCWYQRIAMYPLALVLTVAAVRRDRSVLPYGLALAGIGFVIAAYHVQLQWFPDQSSFCEAANPCSARWVEALGVFTIPQMAGLSFLLITGLTTLALFTTPEETTT